MTGGSAGFTGQGTIAAGTLVLGNGSGASSATFGGSLDIASGATLSAAGGAVTGAVTIRSGAILSAGQTSGGLSAGSLLLESGATTSVSLAAPSASNALFSVTGASAGALTVDGTLNVTGAAGYGIGVYRIFSSAGALTDNGLLLGTVPSDPGTRTALEIGTRTVDVQVSATGGGGLQYWSANGATRGGAGTWTSTNPWLDANGGTASWEGKTGVFSGTAGIVDLVGRQAFGTLEFLTSGYVLQASGGSLDLGTGGRLWTEGADTVATIAAPLGGTGALTKIGAGTLILSGTNTYSGGTVLSAGTVQVASDANLGAASGALTFNGGRLATTASFQSARAVSLGTGGGTFSTAAATSLTLSGDVTGAGSLTKEGAGTLILTGTNTYTGGTTISAGTLQIGDGGTTGSIVGNVVNNATLVFNRSDRYVFPGTITGTGTLGIIGGGTLVFETANAYSGPITVADATLVLEPGSQSASVFTLGNGAVLKGTGTIGGVTLNAGSTVAPGYSPGTLTVTGAVTFSAGSTYQVDVTPQGAHDLITATGAVTINNGASVRVVAEPGVYAANSTYAILTTSGQLTGAFGSVTSDYAFLTPSLSYDMQNVYLTLAYSAQSAPLFSAFAQTQNQLATATGAQALGVGNGVFDALLTQSAASMPSALNALSGEAYASVDSVIQQQSIYVREAVGARLRASVSAPGAGALGYAAQAGGPQTATLGGGLTPTLWAQGYGGWGSTFSNGNAASITNSLGGFLMGADVALAPNARAGLFAGFSQSQFEVSDRASTGSMDNYDLGAYAGAQFGALALRGGASYSWHDVSLARTIAFSGFSAASEGGYTSGTTQVFGEVGYDVALGAVAVEPFAGLAYVNVSGGSLMEGGGSAAALTVDLDGMSTLYSTLGVRAATRFALNGRSLTPSLTLGWQHAFGDTTPTASMTFAGGTLPFQVSGVPIAQDALLVQAGLAYALSDAASLAVSYSGQLAATASQNAFTAQFALRF